jgi:triosephosphate isomerase
VAKLRPGVYKFESDYKKGRARMQRIGNGHVGNALMTDRQGRPRPRPLVAGNWKMNGLRKDLEAAKNICRSVTAGETGGAEIVICVPATLLMAAAAICENSGIALGAQDCHAQESGAYTGDISAEMLKDAGAAYVIVGHSERRAAYNEPNELVRAKAKAALRAGLTAIICVGETKAERDAGYALPIVAAQLAGSIPKDSPPERIVIAYEPVWAIGSGLTPTSEEIAEMHRFIGERTKQHLLAEGDKIRIIYGGSVKPANAAELMAIDNVDGALVGGASLIAADFLAIAGVFRSRESPPM